jgi:hypothetical protein
MWCHEGQFSTPQKFMMSPVQYGVLGTLTLIYVGYSQLMSMSKIHQRYVVSLTSEIINQGVPCEASTAIATRSVKPMQFITTYQCSSPRRTSLLGVSHGEIPVRFSYDPVLWLSTLHVLYIMFDDPCTPFNFLR